ncbi:UDP-glucuronosyl/UDP-glucosyltransferase [Corchorus olitorius]|uniref:Glycosyltransferase n=1 Tax=Corchorus olitorius TaxID=93759 RepID=A0A1R3K698_9ROSI|nr:UDP-glucuronosyl/UDP-glucosyltransferase [Corchorus olitorius]
MADLQTQILLVTFPVQGHINPSLQFAKRLINLGVHVTFMTATSTIRRMNKNDGLSYASFSDGYDDGFQLSIDINHYMAEIKRCGSQSLREFLSQSIDQGTKFTSIVYCTLLPWVATVAREFHIPATFLSNQPASILNIYYHYFKGYDQIITKNINDPSFSVKILGLPILSRHDLPSFFLSPDSNVNTISTFKEHIEILDQETNPRILVNTLDELESEAMKAIGNGKYNIVGIGPLIPNPTEKTSFGGDLIKVTKEYGEIEWLNSKPENSVIYLSFGSLSVLEKRQNEEIAKGLLETGRPFLWVIRETEGGKELLSCQEELEKQGKIIPWCSQVEVLSHPSVGCFVTHCGWNSTFESLVFGVPTVTFPQWTDQGTNSKLVQDVWRTGVRVTKNDEGLVESSEIKRCLEMVMEGGDRGEEIKRNVKKWKELSREAAMEGGSSDKNLKSFVNELRKN